MRYTAALLATSLCVSAAATAQTAREMQPWQRKNLPRLYAIDLGKTWVDITQYQSTQIDLAGKARANKGCGEDTYFTIMLDFDNTLAYASRDKALDAFQPQQMSTKVRQMFYPKGEVYEMSAPVRQPFANTEAYAGAYRVTFSDGRRYRMRHYTTFQSGYYVHVDTYNLSKDDLRAAPCFASLFENITFHKVKAK
ncbi:MAG: hypothetical protein C0436_02835 [Alphaproteobacteria bacterium]|nr:hypothetical protein [Alphaproteobacteria bacterium]